jgi:hypothetical protein
MASGIQTIELAIQHVRNPGQRMPVRGIRVRKGPNHSRPREARLNMRICRDVCRVIEIDEIMMYQGPIQGCRHEGEHETNHNPKLVAGEFGCGHGKKKAVKDQLDSR